MDYIIFHHNKHKKRAFSFASFDFLRFWTTLIIQTYARKTHAIRERA